MSQNIEIEFKNLLSETEYQHLIQRFQLAEQNFFSQTNYYFDTADFQLKAQHSGLRIREKNGQFELTLKQPTPNQIGLLETNQNIDASTAAAIQTTGQLPDGIVRQQLTTNKPLIHFGNLKTTRAEIPYRNGLLVLDKSEYNHIIDYELEYESEDFEKGKKIFSELLMAEKIPKRPTQNKIQRLYCRTLSK